ncbi:MAG TPA: hypothetical protein VF797_05210 [Noviherbaspirillum sp.]
MKRASTLDKHSTQLAEQHAATAKANISKEENNGTADNKTSGHSLFKKIKLSVRKDSAPATSVSHCGETEQRPSSPVSSPRRETASARQTTESCAAGMRSPNASAPVLRNASSKLSTAAEAAEAVPASADTQVQASSGPSHGDLLSPETDTASRRQQWLEKDKFSFVFEEVTDPTVLALCDTLVPSGAPAATGPQLSEREQKRQLQPIADAIKTALESAFADVMRKFMDAGKQQGVPTPEYQAAHHAFSGLMQMFNRAKVAAVEGREAEMIAELQNICPVLEKFIANGLKDATQHFSGEKSEKVLLKTGLSTLLAQCREWLGEDKEEAIRPWSPSFAPSSPQGRQRSVSSPVKANESFAETEGDKIRRMSASFSGPISSHPSQHRIGLSIPGMAATLSPTSTPSGSPLTSPVQSPQTLISPKESTKSLFRLPTLIGSPGSPRTKEASRKDSSVKGQSRQSLLNESTSHASLSVPQCDKPASLEKAKTEKSKKKFH